MGAVFSKIQEVSEHPKFKSVSTRGNDLLRNAWWLGGHVLWTSITAFIVLGIPPFFMYEKECTLMDQMQQMQEMEMNSMNAAQAVAAP